MTEGPAVNCTTVIVKSFRKVRTLQILVKMLWRPWTDFFFKFCVLWYQDIYYKNANRHVFVTLDKKLVSSCILDDGYSQEKTWQPFAYPEALPIRRLSFVQWFHSSMLQSRYPEPKCYHWRQREKHTITYLNVLLHIWYNSCLSQCEQCLAHPVDSRADLSNWANNLTSQLVSPGGFGHWVK